MNLTIESVFKQDEATAFCGDVAKGVSLSQKCRALTGYAAAGCALYGFSMGLQHSLLQAASSAAKVFFLFGLTLAICLPTLHFIGLLFGARVRLEQTLTVLLGGVSLTGTLLGAFAPISLFFLFSGSSYEFLLLLHVAVFSFCGGAGLLSVRRNMREIAGRAEDDDEARRRSNRLMNVWFGVYMFIGAQMSFILSPFVGRSEEFFFLVSKKGDFFSYVFDAMLRFLGGS